MQPRANPGIEDAGDPDEAEQTFKFECFLIGYDGQLYDQWIEIGFQARLRDICTFDSVDLLQRQLMLDVAAAQKLAKEWSNGSAF